jgi:phosphoglycolate phosphatase
MHPALRAPKAVLFDLDGTLADTARDLVEPVNAMRVERGLPALPFETLRPHASAGARGLLGAGFGLTKDDEQFAPMREEFLRRYEAAMLVHTRLFPGMQALLDALERKGIAWGIVSNKFERYVRQVAAGLGLSKQTKVLIGGDTTPTPKPHPAPLLLGASMLGLAPTLCVYVGDDKRDIEAGRAAGMATVACAYGFCGDMLPPDQWGADAVVEDVAGLQKLWA